MDQTYEVDLIAFTVDHLFFFKCLDTYQYSIDVLNNLFSIQKKLQSKSSIIFIYTKDAKNFDYKNPLFTSIKYKFDYNKFKDNLKEIILRKLIEL